MSLSKSDKKMNAAAVHAEVGGRVSYWLRQEWPVKTAESASVEFNVSVATAKRWIAGHAPTMKHLSAMLRKWGKRFAAFVLEPTGDWTVEWRIEAELEALQTRLADLEEEYQRLRGRDVQ
jgi:hypothetical protein